MVVPIVKRIFVQENLFYEIVFAIGSDVYGFDVSKS